MVFSITYQTQTNINLGSVYSSSPILFEEDEDILTFSSSIIKGNNEFISLNNETGEFIIEGKEIGEIQFIIIVSNQFGIGYNIPISIYINDENINNNYLQYVYQTGYSFSSAINIFPINTPNNQNSKLQYSIIGEPSGITIDPLTGHISGRPINYGHFKMTVFVINISTNMFICSTLLDFRIYNNNSITEILSIFPNNEIIHSKQIPLTIACSFSGAPPSRSQILSYKITCNAFTSSSIINYEISDTLKLTYLVNLLNKPGDYPIILTDEIGGSFIQTNSDIYFSSTAACFNEDTTVLVLNELEEEEFICIKDIKIGTQIKTYKHGFKKVKYISNQTLINNPETISDSMYKLSTKIEKEKITHDLIILGRHSLLVDKLSKRQKIKTMDIHPVDKIDDKELLITMFNEDFDQIVEEKEFIYYHLVLESENSKDQRYGIYVNGSILLEKSGIIAATMYEKDFLKQFSIKY
jgi:hypothetical protein